MLSHILRALCARMAPIGLPVYLAECVPPDAALPFLTARMALPLSPHATGSLTLTLWQSEQLPHRVRLLTSEQLLSRLPARGFRLDTPACTLTLRQTGGALSLKEGDALGLRTVWLLRCYPKEVLAHV